jgi:hypothetical protein
MSEKMNKKNRISRQPFSMLIIALALLSISPAAVLAAGKPFIFPIPSEIQVNEGKFRVDETAFIAIPENGNDNFLIRLFSNELADRFQRTIAITKKSKLKDTDKFILIGDLTNPLIKAYCAQNNLISALARLGDEGYILSVSENSVVVAANSKKGALFGYESLRQVIAEDEKGDLFIPRLVVKDDPRFAFRGIRLYLPGRENIPFFKRFIKDFAALYKFNKIIIEVNANMRLDRHPELNIGAVEFDRHLNLSRLERPPGKHMEFQNSSHADNADGGVLEKEEVADLVKYIRAFNIEVIPEIPSLTHSYYLLAGHKDLAENYEQPYPDTYCPSRPGIYKIYFDVLDEYIDVIHPSMINIGHDEWRVEKNLCPLCRGKDYGRLFADDVKKIHDYLAKKGIKTAMWGDHLLESVRGKDHQEWKSSSGYTYNIPGGLTSVQVQQLIPKDILILNWFWDDRQNDKQIVDFGFKQAYGNLTPGIAGWGDRVKTKGLLGGAPSSWAASTELNFGKDLIYEFLGVSNLLWSGSYLAGDKLALITQKMVDGIRQNLSGKQLPGELGIDVRPVNISPYFNASLKTGFDSLNADDLITGYLHSDKAVFELDSPASQGKRAIVVASQNAKAVPAAVYGIQIDRDVNSILFLHACSKPGFNEDAFAMIYNFAETAELLGWYEIVYEDGYVETIPIRYGINILDLSWQKRLMDLHSNNSGQKYVWGARAIICSKENADAITFFSYEWENKRYGKKIKEVNLKSVNGTGKGENAIILLAMSISDNRQETGAKGVE